MLAVRHAAGWSHAADHAAGPEGSYRQQVWLGRRAGSVVVLGGTTEWTAGPVEPS
jgi:hypothetical protein